VVAPVNATENKNSHLGERGGSVGSRRVDEEEGDKATPGRAANGKDLLGLIRDTTLRQGVGIVTEALRHSGWRDELVTNWFIEQTEATQRTRLKAAAVFGEWCRLKGVTPRQMAEHTNPDQLVEECVSYIYEAGGSYTTANMCRTGISVLYKDFFGKTGVGDSGLVKQTLRKKMETRKPQGRKPKIWDIAIVMKGIKEEGNKADLLNMRWDTLVGRVGIMLLIYTCCRVKDMFNIVIDRSSWESTEGTMLVTMKTKEGKGRLKSKVIVPTEDPSVDPVRTMQAYIQRSGEVREKGCEFFFIDEGGKPIPSPEKLSRAYLAPYLHDKGVPASYSPYSTKTAVITALFNLKFSKEQISAHTGHSNNSNTALKHYHDPINVWLGHSIAQLATREVGATEIDENSDVGEVIINMKGNVSEGESEREQGEEK
jgi:hypothetical protein